MPGPIVTPGGSGKSFLVNDTKDGDRFCDAAELSEYPPQINAPEMEPIKNSLLNDAYGVKYVDPVSLDFVGKGTTVWHHFPRNGTDIAFYANGEARARGALSRNGKSYFETRWQGTWKQDPGQGLMMTLRSVGKLSWGHEYFECSNGFLIGSRSNDYRPTTDQNGKPVVKNAVWRGCSFHILCTRWTDKHPEKKLDRFSGNLVEWSESQIPPDQLRWDGY